MRKEEDFTDVTLACANNRQFKAHKLVLSGSSQFFKNIFINNNHVHSLIYLKGVTAKYVSSILDFVYNGEVNILQDDLKDFLALANEFELKGLNSTDFSTDEAKQNSPRKNKTKNEPGLNSTEFSTDEAKQNGPKKNKICKKPGSDILKNVIYLKEEEQLVTARPKLAAAKGDGDAEEIALYQGLDQIILEFGRILNHLVMVISLLLLDCHLEYLYLILSG